MEEKYEYRQWKILFLLICKNPTQYRNDKLHELRRDFFITPTPEEHIKLMAANTEIAIDNVVKQIILDHLEDRI